MYKIWPKDIQIHVNGNCANLEGREGKGRITVIIKVPVKRKYVLI